MPTQRRSTVRGRERVQQRSAINLAVDACTAGDDHLCMARTRPYLRPWAVSPRTADHVRSAVALARFAVGSPDLTDEHHQLRKLWNAGTRTQVNLSDDGSLYIQTKATPNLVTVQDLLTGKTTKHTISKPPAWPGPCVPAGSDGGRPWTDTTRCSAPIATPAP